ncbi:unnamed protein product [marine sediment metagenome]|uniref:Uncharacterized protein n=1 Tax=marine sediment metagenome TaxID=412755 RepID=X0U3C8_9ZZZZ
MIMSLRELAQQVQERNRLGLREDVVIEAVYSPLETSESTESIDFVVTTARNLFGEEVARYIREHADRRPEWLKEYHGLAEWMNKEYPRRGRLPWDLAARVVVLWIYYRDLEALSIDEYRKRLANLWEDLRSAPPVR